MTELLKRPMLTIPLFQGADLAKVDELRAELMAAAQTTVAGPTRLLSDTEPSGNEELKAAAMAHDDFVREAEGRAVMIEIVALQRKQWRALEDAHPARTVTRTVKDEDGAEQSVEEPHEQDGLGFNFKTIADDLVTASVVLVKQDGSVQFASEGERNAFLDDLSDPHFNALYAGALKLNTEGSQVPKAGGSSLVERIIAATSTSLDP